MRQLIIINSSHYDSTRNCFSYRFPSGQNLSKKEVAISTLNLYNSFFNISQAYGNNQISLTWNANTTVTYTFTIPDGYYDNVALNYFLQQQMIANGLYVTTSTSNVYFVAVVVNYTSYATEIDFKPLPTSANANLLGYTKPSNATWDWPSTAKTCQLSFSKKFGTLIGFETGTYPSIVQSTDTQLLSTFCPELSVVNSLILTSNLIQNVGVAIPPNVAFSVGINVGFGQLINYTGNPLYCDIASNVYNSIDIHFYDQNLNMLTLKDKDLVIVLSIQDKV